MVNAIDNYRKGHRYTQITYNWYQSEINVWGTDGKKVFIRFMCIICNCYIIYHLPIWINLRHKMPLFTITVKLLIQDAPNQKTYMFLASSCSCLCATYWSQVLSRKWRCTWSSADRRCPNYMWVIKNFIACHGATYIRCLTVYTER